MTDKTKQPLTDVGADLIDQVCPGHAKPHGHDPHVHGKKKPKVEAPVETPKEEV